MAFPTVVEVKTTVIDVAANPQPVNMTAVVSVNDLLIMGVSKFNSGGAINTPAGWSVLMADAVVSLSRQAVFYKTAIGDEGGTTLDVDLGGDARAICAVVIQVSGWQAIEAGVAATGSSTTPNPPSLNPAGWGTEDTLWIAYFGSDQNNTISIYPTGYGNNQTQIVGTVAGVIGIATKNNAAASEDPGTFTMSGSDDWKANTFAVRPGSLGGGGPLGGAPYIFHKAGYNPQVGLSPVGAV